MQTDEFRYVGGLNLSTTELRARGLLFVQSCTALVGIACLIWGQRLWFENLELIRPGAPYIVAGLALLVLAMPGRVIAQSAEALISEKAEARLGLRFSLLLVGVGAALCVYAGWEAIPGDRYAWNALALWVAGIALTGAGLIGFRDGLEWLTAVRHSLRTQRSAWVFAGVMLLLALIVRVTWLGGVPSIMAGDEAQFAYEAVWLKDTLGWHYNPFSMGLWHHPHIVHTLMAVSVEIFGQKVGAARLPWGILGALNVPAVYLLARRLFTPRIGVIAALVLLTLPVHLQFSRTAMDMTGDAMFFTLAIACLVGALRDGNPVEAVLAGTFLGATQYFYFAGRLAIPLTAGLLVLYGFAAPRRLWARRNTLIIAALMLAVTVFPYLYATYRDVERPLNPRLAEVSIWATGELDAARHDGKLASYAAHQIQHALLAFVHYEDESDVYGRYYPLMGLFAGVPFMIGLAVVVRRWRNVRGLFLGAWVTGTALAGGALLVDPPHYPRYIIALPGAAILASLGIDAAAHAGAGFWTSLKRNTSSPQKMSDRRARGMAVGVAIVLAAMHLWSYVFGYLPKTDYLLYGNTTWELNEVAGILESFHGRYQVWLFSSGGMPLNGTDLLRYMTPENAGQEYDYDLAMWRDHLEPGPTAFVVAPDRVAEVWETLEELFPYGTSMKYTDPHSEDALIYVYQVIVPSE